MSNGWLFIKLTFYLINMARDTQKETRVYRDAFEEMDELGRGRYTRIYKALHKLDKQEYAVKKVRLDELQIHKQLSEVEALAKLEHKNIIQSHFSWIEEGDDPDYWEDEDETSGSTGSSTEPVPFYTGILHIQMESFSMTLSTWIRNNRVSIERKRGTNQIMHQIVLGVEYIHKMDIIHRDLKPDNIFIQQRSDMQGLQVKIGDFSLVFCITKATGNGQYTSYGVGTPPYAAPEINRYNFTYNEKCDIYSLGIIFFELCHYMGSRMEMWTYTKQLERGSLPASLLRDRQFAQEVEAIKRMVAKQHWKRPSASKLLKGGLFPNEKKVIKQLKEEKKIMDKELRKLRRENRRQEMAMQIPPPPEVDGATGNCKRPQEGHGTKGSRMNKKKYFHGNMKSLLEPDKLC